MNKEYTPEELARTLFPNEQEKFLAWLSELDKLTNGINPVMWVDYYVEGLTPSEALVDFRDNIMECID